MKLSLLVMVPLLTATQVGLAFDRVSEVLPNGNILICLDSNESIENGKLITYASTSDKSNARKKINEETLPQSGAKIELIHDENHQKEKGLGYPHRESLGFGTLITADLTGASRLALSSKKKVTTYDQGTISAAENAQIKANCLVAQTQSNEVYPGAKVRFLK